MSDSQKTDLLQGTLDLLILKVLAPAPLHGYAISQRIQQVSRDILQPTGSGSIELGAHRLGCIY
jgi:DNA-binding PadR family transcriptional regulator